MNWKNAGINWIIIDVSITVVFLFIYLQASNDIEFSKQAVEKQIGSSFGASIFPGLIIASAGIMIKHFVTKFKNKNKP